MSKRAKITLINKQKSAAGKKGYAAIKRWREENPEAFKKQNKEIGKRSAKKIWSNPDTKKKVIKKISKALKGNKNSLGIKRSKETKEILSKQKMGNDYGKYKKMTPELKKRLSDSNKIATERLIKEGKHPLQRMPKITYSEEKFAKMYPKFKRQFPIKRFLADFYDKKTNTVIEIDGSMHNRTERKIFDKKRNKIMHELGYNIARIPAKEVINNVFIKWESFLI